MFHLGAAARDMVMVHEQMTIWQLKLRIQDRDGYVAQEFELHRQLSSTSSVSTSSALPSSSRGHGAAASERFTTGSLTVVSVMVHNDQTLRELGITAETPEPLYIELIRPPVDDTMHGSGAASGAGSGGAGHARRDSLQFAGQPSQLGQSGQSGQSQSQSQRLQAQSSPSQLSQDQLLEVYGARFDESSVPPDQLFPLLVTLAREGDITRTALVHTPALTHSAHNAAGGGADYSPPGSAASGAAGAVRRLPNGLSNASASAGNNGNGGGNASGQQQQQQKQQQHQQQAFLTASAADPYASLAVVSGHYTLVGVDGTPLLAALATPGGSGGSGGAGGNAGGVDYEAVLARSRSRAAAERRTATSSAAYHGAGGGAGDGEPLPRMSPALSGVSGSSEGPGSSSRLASTALAPAVAPAVVAAGVPPYGAGVLAPSLRASTGSNASASSAVADAAAAAASSNSSSSASAAVAARRATASPAAHTTGAPASAHTGAGAAMGGGSALDAALAALGAAAAVAEVAQLEHRQAHHYARVHSEALDGYRLLAAGDAAVPEHVHRVVLLAQTPKLATTGPVGDLALFSSLSFLDVSGNALPLAPLGTLPALEHLMLACNGLRGADLVPIPASEPGGAQEHDDNYNAAAAVAALAVRSGGGGAHTGAGAFADVAADSGGAAVSGRAKRRVGGQRRLL